MNSRYDSVVLNAAGLELITKLKDQAEQVAKIIDQTPCRESSVALTHLEAAVYFAVRAIAVKNQTV